MAETGRTVLKTYFETGDIPTEVQFADSIDSSVNIKDDIENGTDKAIPIDADKFSLWDSVSSSLKTLTWANLKSAVGGGSLDTIKAYKASDESRANDQVLTIDSDLFLDLEANSYYIIRAYTRCIGSSSGNLSLTFNYDNSYDVGVWTWDIDNFNETPLAFGDEIVIALTPTVERVQNLVVWLKTTNAGRFGFDWRQLSSDVDASTMMKMSAMVARKYN